MGAMSLRLREVANTLRTMEGRLATTSVFIGAILYGLWPDHPRPIDVGKSIAVFAAFIPWFFSTILTKSEPNNLDVSLYEKIITHLPNKALEFLKTQDFGEYSFHARQLDGLRHLARLTGPRDEFIDNLVQKEWADTQTHIRHFYSYYACNTFYSDDNEECRTIYTKAGDPDSPTEIELERIHQLNTLATDLYNRLVTFERFARRHLYGKET